MHVAFLDATKTFDRVNRRRPSKPLLKLESVTSFSYLGHIICNHLSDDADLRARSRQMYAKSNTLRQKCHMCSTAVKVKLFTAYLSNVDMCALWVNYRKTTFHQFIVAYNNSYRILNILPMICIASGMFATDNVNYCICHTKIYL